MLKKTLSRFKLNKGISSSFLVGTGLRQGDPLSPKRFNIILEVAIRRIQSNPGGMIYSILIQHLGYADVCSFHQEAMQLCQEH